MDALPTSKKVYTPEEYLEMECESVERHEYRDSEIYQLAGENLERIYDRVELIIITEEENG